MDFDLPDADNDKLRALEAGINDLIRQDLPLRYTYVPLVEATALHGLIRSRSVAPPPATRASSASWRSWGSTVRRAAGRTWPRPRARARCDLEDRQQGPPQPPHPHRPGGLRRGAPQAISASGERCRRRQPRHRRRVACFELADLRFVAERQSGLVLPGQQHLLAEGIDLEAMRRHRRARSPSAPPDPRPAWCRDSRCSCRRRLAPVSADRMTGSTPTLKQFW